MSWCLGLWISLPSHELKANLPMDKPSARGTPQCNSQAMDDCHLTVRWTALHMSHPLSCSEDQEEMEEQDHVAAVLS